MHRENLLIDNGRNRQAVEAVRKRLPQLDVVPSLALIVKPINPVNRRALMVTSQNEEILRVLDLVCKQQANGL